jgi:hypothetical protein
VAPHGSLLRRHQGTLHQGRRPVHGADVPTADRGHGSGPYPVMTRAEMRVGLAANDRTRTASPDREAAVRKLAARLLGGA